MHSHSRTSGFANEFKPAMVLSAMPLKTLASTMFLTAWQEKADPAGVPIKVLSDEIEDPDANKAYQITTRWPVLKPVAREANVSGRGSMKSLIFELDPRGYGIGVVMVQIAGDEAYLNVRILPYSRLVDVARVDKSGVLEVLIPDVDVAKLNVTLKSSPAGETLFRTHEVEAVFPNLPDAVVTEMLSQLELNAAALVANLGKQILETGGNWPLKQATADAPYVDVMAFDQRKALWLLAGGLSIIGATVGIVGALTAAPAAGVAGSVISGLSGLVAVYQGYNAPLAALHQQQINHYYVAPPMGPPVLLAPPPAFLGGRQPIPPALPLLQPPALPARLTGHPPVSLRY